MAGNKRKPIMKASIDVCQATALKLGLDNTGIYVIDFNPADLTTEQREELSKSKIIDGAFCSNHNHSHGEIQSYELKRVGKPDFETLKSIIDERIFLKKEKERKQIDREKKAYDETVEKLTRWVQKPIEDRIERSQGVFSYQPVWNSIGIRNMHNFYDFVPELKEDTEDILSACFWINADDEINKKITDKTREAKQAAEKEKNFAISNARQEQRHAWIRAFGTENQKGRLEENMLPILEIESCMMDQIFEPLTELFDRYVKMKANDVCDCDSEYADRSFTSEIIGAVTDSQYEQIKAMRKALPGAVLKIKKHYGSCANCEENLEKTGIVATITYGAFEFSREYGCQNGS